MALNRKFVELDDMLSARGHLKQSAPNFGRFFNVDICTTSILKCSQLKKLSYY